MSINISPIIEPLRLDKVDSTLGNITPISTKAAPSDSLLLNGRTRPLDAARLAAHQAQVALKNKQDKEYIGLDGLPEALAAMSFEGVPCLSQQALENLTLGEYSYNTISTPNATEQARRPTDYVAITYGQIVEGLAQLAATGVAEITDIISALHCEILLRPIGRFDSNNKEGWDASIIGQAYSVVRTAVKTVGDGVSFGVRTYNQKLLDYNLVTEEIRPVSYRLKLLVNALNGIMGDRLVSQNNPLAVKMALYTAQGNLQKGQLSGNVYILIHGLCMSHFGWRAADKDSLGVKLQQSQPNSTVLYLDYNTGRRIADNGRQLSHLLHTLIHENPDISTINLIGHSMGGLVSRSALFYGQQQRHDWMYLARTLITIGSPHQGAILEQMGNYMVELLSGLPFSGSLVKLADLRSAGIIDLRHGSIRDADWKALGGRQLLPQGFLHPAPPPNYVTTYLIAGTLVGGLYNSATSNLVGDGLVAVESALGEEHEEGKDIDHVLPVPEGHKAVFHGVGHINLLYNARVHQQIIAWLSAGVSQHAFEPCIHSFEDSLTVEV